MEFRHLHLQFRPFVILKFLTDCSANKIRKRLAIIIVALQNQNFEDVQTCQLTDTDTSLEQKNRGKKNSSFTALENNQIQLQEASAASHTKLTVLTSDCSALAESNSLMRIDE